MENGRTVLHFTVEHLAMTHAWLVDEEIEGHGYTHVHYF